MHALKLRRPRLDEAGFTLVELLISIVIMGIILVALTTGLMAFLHNAYVTTKRATHSAGASILAAYLDRDLASAETVSNAPGTTCSGVTNQLVLQWNESVAAPDTGVPSPGPRYTAAYAVVQVAGSSPAGYELRRWLCVGDQTSVGAPVNPSGEIVASNLPASGGVVVNPASLPAGVTSASCPGSLAPLTVELLQYSSDPTIQQYSGDSTNPYFYAGCTKGRIQ